MRSLGEAATITRYRQPGKAWKVISIMLTVIALSLCVVKVFYLRPFGFFVADTGYRYLILAALLPLCFLWIPFRKQEVGKSIQWYDMLLISLSIALPVYFFIHERDVLSRGWEAGAPFIPWMMSMILGVLMIEAGRRAAGPVFAMVIGVFAIYPLFASYMPGFIWSPNVSLNQLTSFLVMSEEGIMGIPMRVFTRLVLGFMFFAVVIQALGAAKFFNDLAVVVIGKTRASNAKIAIFSSALFGSINGQPVANVMTTGAFTIPAMKREGLPPHFAAGVEAAASSGGVIMPPIMGAVAFIMAEFLGVPYSEVVRVAAVPSILYYVTLFAQIDAYAARIGLKPSLAEMTAPSIWVTLRNHISILVGFIVLLVVLFVFRLDAQAPWLATAAMIGVAMFRGKTMLTPKLFVRIFEQAGRVLGELVGIMAPIGMIIGSFIITGLAFSLPFAMVQIAGGNTYAMLLFGAAASFILGMGVSIGAVYIFLAIVLAPGLVQAGFDVLAVHMFILYCGVLSYITPPVALAAFAAATIAGSSPMKTGIQAMKLGVAKYLLPFIFVLNPALVLRGPVSEIMWVVPTALVGLVIISGALEGYIWTLGKPAPLLRILLFGAGLMVVAPNLSVSLFGLTVSIVLLVSSYFLKRKEALLAKIVI